MADFNALTALINAYIKQNGVKAITGQVLNGVLTAMVSALGKGYTVAGEASPTTDPGTMTGPVAYIAHTAGTYEHFGNLVVEDGEVAMLIYDEAVWHKEVLLSLSATATINSAVGTPEVGVSFVNGVLTFDFRNLKGNPGQDGRDGTDGQDGQDGQDGAAAGFGSVTATVDGNVGTPGVLVQTSGPNTAKNFAFAFTNLKGETGVTSCVVTVDNTSGNPACAVSLVGQELHLDFTGLKGAQGNTGSSVDYPFTIVNNLTTDDATQALSAAMGVQLESEISQLEAEVTDLDGDINGVNETQYEEQTLLADHYYGTNGSTMASQSGYGNAEGVYCSRVNVSEGEKYKITGMGGNQYSRLYATANSSLQKLRYAETNLNARSEPLEITIEEGEKYLYVNLNSYDSQTDKFEKVVQVQAPGLKDKVEEHTTEITALQGDFADIDTLKYRKPKIYASNASPNYEQYIQEAYIVKLPAGSVILKRYGSDVYFYTKSSGVYARAALSSAINGKPVPVKVYNTNDSVNYPENLVVGYIVFSDVTGFSSASSSTSETAYIVREVAENIAYSPIISTYLDLLGVEPIEKVEVSLPSTIYAVVGDTLQLYYRSIFRCVDYTKYNVDVECNIGAQYPRYYEVTPAVGNIGTRTITFSIRDNNNNVLGTKSANLVVVASGQSPASELNVLCVGASATLNGEWASELKRRLTASGGTPSGSNLSNIIFVGRKSKTYGGKQVNLEATGGYQFTSYTAPTTTRYRFDVTAENEPTINIGDVYSNNGHNYTIVEINISAGTGGYFSCTGDGTPQESGTLTKVTGTGSATITYSSTSLSGNPFAYGGVIDMQQYADEYCNPQNAEHGRIDVVYTELFGNGTSAYMTDFSTRMSQMQAFITQVKTAFPSCKFLIGLFWNPDLKGGMGVNYGASGNWHNPYGIKFSNHGLCNALQKYITDNNLSDDVFIVNWLNEFDEENDMQQTTKKVNPRSNVTEIFGVNGVHPSDVGYYQMADTAWRLFIAKFCQS